MNASIDDKDKEEKIVCKALKNKAKK